MKKILLKLTLLCFISPVVAQSNQVLIVNNKEGMKLVVDGSMIQMPLGIMADMEEITKKVKIT